MMPNDFCFGLKRRSSSARFLPNYNRSASTILSSVRVCPLQEPRGSRDISQEPIHREPAHLAGGANVCARDRKMAAVAAVTNAGRPAFPDRVGPSPGVWSVLDTLATTAPLPAH